MEDMSYYGIIFYKNSNKLSEVRLSAWSDLGKTAITKKTRRVKKQGLFDTEEKIIEVTKLWRILYKSKYADFEI